MASDVGITGASCCCPPEGRNSGSYTRALSKDSPTVDIEILKQKFNIPWAEFSTANSPASASSAPEADTSNPATTDQSGLTLGVNYAKFQQLLNQLDSDFMQSNTKSS